MALWPWSSWPWSIKSVCFFFLKKKRSINVTSIIKLCLWCQALKSVDFKETQKSKYLKNNKGYFLAKNSFLVEVTFHRERGLNFKLKELVPTLNELNEQRELQLNFLEYNESWYENEMPPCEYLKAIKCYRKMINSPTCENKSKQNFCWGFSSSFSSKKNTFVFK